MDLGRLLIVFLSIQLGVPNVKLFFDNHSAL